MGAIMIQEIIVGAIVLAAVAFVVRKYFWKSKKASGGCGSCGGCDKGSCS
ncbi:FeoB-associated Cys-rich membrane protein [Kingella negevensis]|nr:FeoB-associated Cys-rich membrane protein [Kingella negevensis]